MGKKTLINMTGVELTVEIVHAVDDVKSVTKVSKILPRNRTMYLDPEDHNYGDSITTSYLILEKGTRSKCAGFLRHELKRSHGFVVKKVAGGNLKAYPLKSHSELCQVLKTLADFPEPSRNLSDHVGGLNCSFKAEDPQKLEGEVGQIRDTVAKVELLQPRIEDSQHSVLEKHDRKILGTEDWQRSHVFVIVGAFLIVGFFFTMKSFA